MRIGFSSSVCPDQDLRTIVEQAKAFGYDAVELRNLQGHAHLPGCPALTDAPGVRSLFASAGVALACLGTDCSFDASERRMRADHAQRVRETIACAADLGCPYVTVRSGSVPAWHRHDRVLLRVVEAIGDLAPEAAEHGVTLLVENDGTLAGSRDLWFIVDAVGHPAVRACWNPANAIAAGDNHGLAVPRIGRMAAMARLCDGTLDSTGRIVEPAAIGQGQLQLDRFLVLMRGLGSEADLIVDMPAGAKTDAAEMLSASIEWIKQQREALAATPDLTAYKGDKNAPRYAGKA